MGDADLPRKMTPTEYLAFERTSANKHEYADGEIFAMAGELSVDELYLKAFPATQA